MSKRKETRIKKGKELINKLWELSSVDSIVDNPFLYLLGKIKGHKIKNVDYFEFSTNNKLSACCCSRNTCEIFYEKFKASNIEDKNRIANMALKLIARKLNFSLINGFYSNSTTAKERFMMRGVVNHIESNFTDAKKNKLNKKMLDDLFFDMKKEISSGECYIFVGSKQIEVIKKIYEVKSKKDSCVCDFFIENVHGINIIKVKTEYGNVGFLCESMMHNDIVLFVDMSELLLVSCQFKGMSLFMEKNIVNEDGHNFYQIYGQFSIDVGNENKHALIVNLKV